MNQLQLAHKGGIYVFSLAVALFHFALGIWLWLLYECLLPTLTPRVAAY